MKIPWFILFSTALLLAAHQPTVASLDSTPTKTRAVRVGDVAPDFTVRSFDGDQIQLSEQAGEKPILIIFWSFFCFPCQKEIPRLEALYQELTSERLGIIGVCLDGPEYNARVLPFVDENGITFPNGYDRQTDEFFEIAEQYGVVGTPTSFLLDAQGRIRSIHLGRLEPEVLKLLVQNAGEKSFCAEITKPSGTSQK